MLLVRTADQDHYSVQAPVPLIGKIQNTKVQAYIHSSQTMTRDHTLVSACHVPDTVQTLQTRDQSGRCRLCLLFWRVSLQGGVLLRQE